MTKKSITSLFMSDLLSATCASRCSHCSGGMVRFAGWRGERGRGAGLMRAAAGARATAACMGGAAAGVWAHLPAAHHRPFGGDCRGLGCCKGWPTARATAGARERLGAALQRRQEVRPPL